MSLRPASFHLQEVRSHSLYLVTSVKQTTVRTLVGADSKATAARSLWVSVKVSETRTRK